MAYQIVNKQLNVKLFLFIFPGQYFKYFIAQTLKFNI